MFLSEMYIKITITYSFSILTILLHIHYVFWLRKQPQ